MNTQVITGNDLAIAENTVAIVRSEASQRLMAMVRRVAATPAAVLIEGETGTGKELIARAIHQLSVRKHRPWIDVNCSALPEHLLESELFGYEKGAFSGAEASKPGMFELAHNGTLFLDEIGELDPKIQAKLLRVLDGAPYYRLGGTRKISVDVRIVSATNRNLESAVRQGGFRKDLFYRLGQIQLRVPPLRDRPEDIAGISEKILEEYRPGARFDGEAMEALRAYTWPGNVRELKNTIMAIATLGDSGTTIKLSDLPQQIAKPDSKASGVEDTNVLLGDLDSVERVMIERALQACEGDQAQAADQLGISRRTLSRKLKLYRLEESCRSSLGTLGSQQQRYFRAALESIVVLRANGYEAKARSVNVSLSGIGLQDVAEPFRLGGLVELLFSLEETSSPIEAKGKMTWADALGHAGLRFVSMTTDAQRQLNTWLEARRQQEGWHN
jgi:transcriptional regulator with PAS, ATPase and Fis domain